MTGSQVSETGKPEVVLALETATRRLSIALIDSSGCIAEVSDDSERIHSERLLPAVDSMFKRVGLGLQDLTGVALAIGPGSFTGLRIGLATVKGLTFGSSMPVVGVSTLAGLAASIESERVPRGAILDAQRGEVYAGWSFPGPDRAQLEIEGVYSTTELADCIPAKTRIAVGEGAEAFSERLAKNSSIDLITDVVSSARNIGKIGMDCLKAGVGVSANGLAPRYLRRAEAEVRRTGNRFE